jgi:DNA-binding protein Fis
MKESIKKPSERQALLALTEERLLRVFLRKYCLQRHVSLKDLMKRFEREIICMALTQSYGSQRAAARMLGIRPSTLNYKIQTMGLVPVRKYLMIEDLPESVRLPYQEEEAALQTAPARYRPKRERRGNPAACPGAGTAGTRR